MGAKLNLLGMRFGRLLVLEENGRDGFGLVLCRQLERELLIVGVALDNQNERWGLYGNAIQAALKYFKARNADGLPNAKGQR